MPDSPLAKIESDIRGFVRASYPDMIVHAEHCKQDPSRIGLFFIDEHFEGLYPRQRHHYLVHLIPTILIWQRQFGSSLRPDSAPNTVRKTPIRV